jgi:peptidoglycan/LPS O-acetylase OafA/YrhL
MEVTGTAEQKSAPTPVRSPSPHLWQVDVVRLLAFTAVIAVHSLAFTEQPSNRVAAAAMMLLQYGRDVFFALTGFVLVYSAWNRGPGNRDRGLRGVGIKRFSYVAVPYIVWSAIYYAYSVFGPQHLHASLLGFGQDLLDGGAMYHLYFLLVTLQLYLVFPALLKFVRRTAHQAGRVLGIVAVANLAWLAAVQYVPIPSGPASWLWRHAYEILPTYSMYVLAGCYAAVHLATLQRFVERHSLALIAAAISSAVVAVGAYIAQLQYMAPRSAASVLQPASAFSSFAALILLYLLGSRWASGPRRHEKAIALLSDASFGVYLAHPIILQVLLDHGLGNSGQQVPAALATLVGMLGAAAGGLAITLIARRTPLSLALCGRPKKPVETHRARPLAPKPRLSLVAVQEHSQGTPSRVYEPAQARQGI